MDCRTARLLLDFARPLSTELEASEAEALHCHLADCSQCGALAQVDRQADERIGQAVRDVPVPDGLRERLLSRLATERDAWYRRWLMRATGIAAAITLAVWLGWSLRGPRPAEVDLEKVYTDAIEQRNFDPERIQAAFRMRGIRTVVPDQFDPRYFAFYGLGDFQGQSVPQLVFIRQDRDQGAAFARVFIVNSRQFDMDSLKRLAGEEPAGSGEFKVRVIVDPQHPQFAYVVLYTGGPDDWFLNKSNTRA